MANTFILVVLRSFQEWLLKKQREMQQPGPRLTVFWESLLCAWDSAHRMELVANGIRVDREDVDVELMVVPWYSQTPKDIAAI